MKRSHIQCEMLNSLTNLNLWEREKMFFNFNLNAPVSYKCVILFVIWNWDTNCLDIEPELDGFGGEKKSTCYLFVSMFSNFYPNQWVKITKYLYKKFCVMRLNFENACNCCLSTSNKQGHVKGWKTWRGRKIFFM